MSEEGSPDFAPRAALPGCDLPGGEVPDGRSLQIIGSTRTSSALEGNTLTPEEARVAILQPQAVITCKPADQVQEVRSHAAALRHLDALLARGREFDREDLFGLHAILMAGTPVEYLQPVGEWKREPNQSVIRLDGAKVTNDTYAHPRHVPALMEIWLADFNTLILKPCDPVAAHINLHAAFVRIHPFADGNGRLARMLANAPFIARGLPPLDIQPEDRDEYLAAIARWQIACGPPVPGQPLLAEPEMLHDFRELCVRRAPALQ